MSHQENGIQFIEFHIMIFLKASPVHSLIKRIMALIQGPSGLVAANASRFGRTSGLDTHYNYLCGGMACHPLSPPFPVRSTP
jgi:hypothetical protein